MMRSWSNSFKRHVAEKRRASKEVCVRCGKSGAVDTWAGDYVHLTCLSNDERWQAWGFINA